MTQSEIERLTKEASEAGKRYRDYLTSMLKIAQADEELKEKMTPRHNDLKRRMEEAEAARDAALAKPHKQK